MANLKQTCKLRIKMLLLIFLALSRLSITVGAPTTEVVLSAMQGGNVTRYLSQVPGVVNCQHRLDFMILILPPGIVA